MGAEVMTTIGPERIHARDCPIVTSHKGWEVIQLPDGKGYLARHIATKRINNIIKNSALEAVNFIDLQEDASDVDRADQRALLQAFHRHSL